LKKVLALEHIEGVTVVPGLKDIRDAYASGKIFFAPMQIGTGLQNKLLEAMAMEKPCVTSVLANRALEASHGENILVGDHPEQYATHISKLLKNHDLCKKLGTQGRAYVQEKFSWEASCEILNEVLSAQSEPVSV
jgi:glycosyltransferase involved in cell wall biosynthesis